MIIMKNCVGSLMGLLADKVMEVERETVFY